MTDNRTTELREKLDELGIEHFDYDKGGRTQTMWESPEGMRHFTYETAANPAKTAKFIIGWFPTPEQAIAATLGNGTCEVIGSYYYDDYDQYEFEFSCGHSVNMYDKEPPNYCPNCGANVIQGVDNAD